METSHKVKIWSIRIHKGKTKTTYRVRWVVSGNSFGESFDTAALADSFRSSLVSAARNGEAFGTESGLPVSMIRRSEVMTWFDFACAYADMKWPDSSPKYRSSLAESLMTVTIPMLHGKKSLPQPQLLRKALKAAFNTKTREAGYTAEIATAVKAAERASRNVADLADPEVLRSVLRALDMRLDGKRADTARIRRVTLGNAIDFAMEKRLLTSSPLQEVKTKKRNFVLRQVDPQAVVNPIQARMLLEAVGTIGKQGPPLVAFFGLMYYAALRPEEVANLKKQNLSIPGKGWGDIHLERARPEIGQEWTDSGSASEEGPLKHREADTGRTVPCPPF